MQEWRRPTEIDVEPELVIRRHSPLLESVGDSVGTRAFVCGRSSLSGGSSGILQYRSVKFEVAILYLALSTKIERIVEFPSRGIFSDFLLLRFINCAELIEKAELSSEFQMFGLGPLTLS
jgi:hypothetical protein